MGNIETVISVKEARKLLGRRARTLSDVEVIEIIEQLDFIASLWIKHRKSQSINERK